MESQKIIRSPISGMLFFVVMILAIWIVDAIFGLPPDVAKTAVVVTFITAIAVSL